MKKSISMLAIFLFVIGLAISTPDAQAADQDCTQSICNAEKAQDMGCGDCKTEGSKEGCDKKKEGCDKKKEGCDKKKEGCPKSGEKKEGCQKKGDSSCPKDKGSCQKSS